MASRIQDMGGTVSSTFTTKVTHVVFKDGKKSTLDKAKKRAVCVVSTLWVEACRSEHTKVDETLYQPASLERTLSGSAKKFRSMRATELDAQASPAQPAQPAATSASGGQGGPTEALGPAHPSSPSAEDTQPPEQTPAASPAPAPATRHRPAPRTAVAPATNFVVLAEDTQLPEDSPEDPDFAPETPPADLDSARAPADRLVSPPGESGWAKPGRRVYGKTSPRPVLADRSFDSAVQGLVVPPSPPVIHETQVDCDAPTPEPPAAFEEVPETVMDTMEASVDCGPASAPSPTMPLSPAAADASGSPGRPAAITVPETQMETDDLENGRAAEVAPATADAVPSDQLAKRSPARVGEHQAGMGAGMATSAKRKPSLEDSRAVETPPKKQTRDTGDSRLATDGQGTDAASKSAAGAGQAKSASSSVKRPGKRSSAAAANGAAPSIPTSSSRTKPLTKKPKQVSKTSKASKASKVSKASKAEASKASEASTASPGKRAMDGVADNVSAPREATSDPTKRVKKVNKIPSKTPAAPRRTLGSIVLSRLPGETAEVVTGIVEHLGGYHLSEYMDENTTHVVSAGIRTLKVSSAPPLYLSAASCKPTTRIVSGWQRPPHGPLECASSHRSPLSPHCQVLGAMSQGLWVVSPEWVLKSLEAGKWLPEAPFELHTVFPGARRFREERDNRKEFRSAVFRDHNVFIGRNTSPSKAQLTALVTGCGGKVRSRPRLSDTPHPSKARADTFFRPPLASPRHLGQGLLLTLRSSHSQVVRAAEQATVVVDPGHPGEASVGETWVLDSITQHKALPLQDYR